MVKVSVIMPVYNCEDFLKGSVESILNQTLSDLELICVDDGSTDNSLDILKEYENNDSRVKVFALNHLGGGDARNFALKQVCGEYLYFMDADDILDLNAFETFFPLSKEKNLDFLMFKAKKYDVNEKKFFEYDYYNMAPLSNFKDKVFNFNDLDELIFNINVTPWCKFYNTEFVRNSGAKFRSKSKFHDNQFFWDIIFQAERIYFLDEFYYTQNVHPNSLIESAGKSHCDIVDVQNNIWELFKKHGQFEKFKQLLYVRKMGLYLMRYNEIKVEFRELFFKKMKEDFTCMNGSDFRDFLAFGHKFVFDSVMISQNHNDFDILKELYYILINGSYDTNQKMSHAILWFDGLSNLHKRFSFNYIREYFKNHELTPENREFLNNFQQYLISVVMPVYNCEDYLKESVESILNQTFRNLELICVDDGSTDNSLGILKEYEKQDSRVKVFSIGHVGGGYARNFALNHVSGEYLYFMDADDVLDLNAFETFYPLSKEKNLDFLMFKAKNYDVNENIIYERAFYNMDSLSKRVKDDVFNFSDISDLIFDVNVTPWSKFYNTDFVLNSGAHFKEGSKFNDNQFFWDIIFQAERIYFLDEFFYTHTVRSDSLIGSRGKNHCDSIDVNNDILDLFKKHGQFENFKKTLYNRKIHLLMMRYDEIDDEYNDLFFLKMKQDFKANIDSDFRVNLWDFMKFIYDSVLISKNHEEFDILKEYYTIIRSNNLSLVDKMDSIKRWFDGLNKNHKMFAFAFIKKDLTEDNMEFFRKFLFNVSVIIPVFNVEDYLVDAFNSLLNQSIGFENLQVIFVDDASTDSSPQIIKKYSEVYDNVISVFLDKNSGYAGLPRNVGMKYANADYIMFLDPDDVFTHNACEILYSQITSENLDIVSGLLSDGEKVPDWIWINLLTDPQEPDNERVKKSQNVLKDSNFELKLNTIDECPSVISAANIWSKIFKKSLIEENNITFPPSVPAEDSVFLLEALLNASGIKFINDVIVNHRYGRPESSQNQFSKDKIIKRINAYFMMFYTCIDKNKTEIFKHYLLGDKLRHLIMAHIMKCNMPSSELLEIFIYSKPLFKLYVDYGGRISDNFQIFKDIAKGDFENAVKRVQGEDTPKSSDIKCFVSADFQIGGCAELSKDWQNQFNTLKPDLFIFDNQNRNDEILNYCRDNNIQAMQFDNSVDNLADILDSVNFKYVPDLKHLVLIYRLDNLRDLNDITNHFHSINYPFKHLKMITTEDNLFLSDTILESDLDKLDFGDNYYCCFVDLDFEFDEDAFIKHDLECVECNSVFSRQFDTDNVLKYPIVKGNDLNHFVHTLLPDLESSDISKNILNNLEKKYKVSIIMPIFNRGNVISYSINSVINQSFKNFELVIIDDGSSDNACEFIKERYGNFLENGKIKYFKFNHEGISAARNFGLKQSKGNIIAYLDSDNRWSHDFLEKMIFELDDKDFNCGYCSVKVHHLNKESNVLNSEFNRKSLLKQNFIDINSFIHKKELYITKGGFDEELSRLGEWDLIIRYTEKNNPYFVNKILVNNFNRGLTEPLERDIDYIREKYWPEFYEDEYNLIVDYFDQEYYLDEYGDVLREDIHPIYHFLSEGYKEMRNPNAEFNISKYCEEYPELIEKEINPFIHYIKFNMQNKIIETLK